MPYKKQTKPVPVQTTKRLYRLQGEKDEITKADKNAGQVQGKTKIFIAELRATFFVDEKMTAEEIENYKELKLRRYMKQEETHRNW